MASRPNVEAILNDENQAYKIFLESWRTGIKSTRLSLSRLGSAKEQLVANLTQKKITTSAALDILQRARDLTLRVLAGNCPQAMCAMQDALFDLTKRFPANLRSLHITITIIMPNDDNGHDLVVSEQAAAPFLRQQTINEYKHIQPGQLSRPHLVAFLADPLRTLRKLKLDKGKAGFSMEFKGCTGNVPAWSEIPRRLTDIVTGESEQKDYELFSRHYAALCPLLGAIDTLCKLFEETRQAMTWTEKGDYGRNTQLFTPPRATPEEPIDLTRDNDVVDLTDETPSAATAFVTGQSKINAVLDKLACARIRGRVKATHTHRTTLLRRAKRLATWAIEWSKDEVLRAAAERVIELVEALGGLEPESTKVSYYGYNELDRRLEKWQTDRQGFVHYQSERKVGKKRKADEEAVDEAVDEREAVRNKMPLWPGGPLRAHKRAKLIEEDGVIRID